MYLPLPPLVGSIARAGACINLTCVLSIPTGQLRLWALQVRSAGRSAGLGLRVARAAQRCMPAAGPHETASTSSDEPEQREYLRFVNFLFAPDFVVVLFEFVLPVS